MKSLIKLAVGAAIAGALVNLLMKQQRSGRGMEGREENFGDRPEGSEGAGATQGTAGFTVEELAADTNSVGREEDGRGQQPQDWRGAQNVLGS
jgi:hypothetical protein